MSEAVGLTSRTHERGVRARTDFHSAVDASLVASVATGHERALGALYARYAPLVYNLARQLCGPDRAEEVTNDIFTALWQKPNAFDPTRGTLRAYLATQAHSRAVDLLRSETARKKRELATIDRGAPVGDTEIDALVRLAASEIQTLLDELPKATRQAIVLAYFGGLTYREVADRLGQPEGTTKSRIRSGLTHLRTKLVDQSEDIDVGRATNPQVG